MIPGGILSNRYDLKKVLFWSWALSIPAPLINLFATSWQEATIALILIQLTSFGLPAYNAFIVANAKPEKVSSAFGASYSAGPLGFLLSPIVGSLILNWTGLGAVFILSFVLFTLSTLLLLPMGAHPAKLEDRSVRIEIPRTRTEITILVFLTASAFAFSLAFPFVPLYVQDRFGVPLNLIQLIGAIYYLGGTIFAVLIGQRAETKGRTSALAIGILLPAAGLIGLILTGSVLLAVPMIFLFGAARAPTYVGYSLLAGDRQNSRRNSSRAGLYGFYLTIESIGLIAGSYAGGSIYSVSSFLLFGLSAGIFLILALIALYWIKPSSGQVSIPEMPPGQHRTE